MRIILDTHIFLWSLYEPEKLSAQHLSELESLSNTIFLSSISMVEIMIKNTIGKLSVDIDLLEVAKESGFELLDFNAFDALAMKDMPLHHKDPFDRMLIAQAIANQFHMMTEDRKFKDYGIKLL